jgi:hypothetical protein
MIQISGQERYTILMELDGNGYTITPTILDDIIEAINSVVGNKHTAPIDRKVIGEE